MRWRFSHAPGNPRHACPTGYCSKQWMSTMSRNKKRRLKDLIAGQENKTYLVFLNRITHPVNLPEGTAKGSSFPIKNGRDGIAEILFTIGSILQGVNAMEESAAYLRLTLYLRPSYDPARLLLGGALERSERHKEANGIYDEIEPGTAYYHKAQIRKASNRWHMGDHSEALALLDEVNKNEPELIDAMLTKGDLLRNDKQFEQAALAYSEAITRIDTIKTHHWPILYARAICNERAGQWEKAEPDFLRALELKPGQPDVLNYLGYSWLIQGKHIVRAKEMIEEAITARPQDAHIIDSMAWALYSLGEFEEALDYMEQAVMLAPRDPTINDHLGDVYWRLGRRTEARYQWERALTFKPEEPGMEENIQRKLKEGMEAFTPPAVQEDKDDVTILTTEDAEENTPTPQP